MKTWQRLKQNPSAWKPYFVREKVIDAIRSFFKERQFHEAQTPILVPVPSAESNLEVFETKLTTSRGEKRPAFLIMSPEYALKKLLTAGIGNVFEITRCFRNEEDVSPSHNPEFTMLEWYRVNADYTDIMTDFESLFLNLITITQPDVDLSRWQYQGVSYDLSTPWPRLSISEVFKKYAAIDTDTLLSPSRLAQAAKGKGYQVESQTTWEQLFYQIFLNEIEPNLKSSGKPAIIYDYPLSQAALARKKAADSRFAERFEIFLAGLELGNCFSELTNWQEQRSRFESDLAERRRLGKTPYGVDDDFIQALQVGMPEAAGIAVGVDRLIMLAADVANLADTLYFPAAELFDLM